MRSCSARSSRSSPGSIGIDPQKAFFVELIVYGVLLVLFIALRPRGLVPEGATLRGLARGPRALSGRIEMLKAEGWTPAVGSRSVQRLAEAEQEYLETATTSSAPPVRSRRRDPERSTVGTQAPVMLEVKELSKRFGGIVAADELSMTLRQGVIVALVGPNGAGKTTVFNLLTGVHPARPGLGQAARPGAGRPRSPTPSPGAAWCGRSRTSACSSG